MGKKSHPRREQNKSPVNKEIKTKLQQIRRNGATKKKKNLLTDRPNKISSKPGISAKTKKEKR